MPRPVELVVARGHTHTSLTMVDVVLSGARVREEIALVLCALLRTPAAVRPHVRTGREGARP